MERVQLAAIAASGTKRNLSIWGPRRTCAVGRGPASYRRVCRGPFLWAEVGEMNGAGAACGYCRKRNEAEFINMGPPPHLCGGERRNEWSGCSLRLLPQAERSGIYFDEIQDSSPGSARNRFRRSMSSGRILPSPAATSHTASKLDRLKLVTSAAARRSRPFCKP